MIFTISTTLFLMVSKKLHLLHLMQKCWCNICSRSDDFNGRRVVLQRFCETVVSKNKTEFSSVPFSWTELKCPVRQQLRTNKWAFQIQDEKCSLKLYFFAKGIAFEPKIQKDVMSAKTMCHALYLQNDIPFTVSWDLLFSL